MSKSCHEEISEDLGEFARGEPELSDEDILDAMRQIPGYIDISTEDFRLIYRLAWRHALQRLREKKREG